MRKLILTMIVAAVAVTGGAATATAQKKKIKARAPKTREVTIYVYRRPPETSGEFYGKIVPVKRQIVDYKPLSQALKLLLEGANEAEGKRNLESFIFELEFVSSRIRNRTAQIHFKFQNPEIALESWEGGGFDHENFIRAVEKTARQFPGVERVSFCIDGMQGLTGSGEPTKCPFKMFPAAKLPPLPRK